MIRKYGGQRRGDRQGTHFFMIFVSNLFSYFLTLPHTLNRPSIGNLFRLFSIFSDFLGRLQPSKTTSHYRVFRLLVHDVVFRMLSYTFLRVPTCSYLFLLPQISSNFLQLRRTSSNLTKHFAVSLPSMTLCRHQASYCLITAYLSLLLISFPTLFYFLNLQLSPTSCVVTAVPLPSISLCRFRAHYGVVAKHTTVSLVSIFIFVSCQSACVKISAWVLLDSALKM